MISASSSNWLDRLRSSRGFPTGEEPDLDRILSSSSSGSAPTPDSATHSESTQSAAIPTRLKRVNNNNNNESAECAGEFAGVLCDLFNISGESSRTFSKKSSRKQANPRFCGPSSETELPSSSDDLRKDKSENSGLLSSGDNSLNVKRDNNKKNDNTNHNNNNNVKNNGNVRVDKLSCDDEEEEDIDLKAYSRSEVTIIDTSFEEWKTDKWVFRKNDEWKIKEKKSKFKSRISGVNKRKLLVNNLGDNDKLVDHQLKKKLKKDENLLQQNKGHLQNGSKREPIKERVNIPGKVPQRRFPCPRPPEKFRSEGSPQSQVILLKSIPVNDPSAAIKLGKSFQKKHPKQMKIV